MLKILQLEDAEVEKKIADTLRDGVSDSMI